MPNDTDAATAPAAHANASDTANAQQSSDIDARINRIVTARLERHEKKLESRFDQLTQLLEKVAGDKTDAEPVKKPDGNSAEGEQQKLTLKALQDQIAQLNKGIENERKKREEAEAVSARTRKDAEVRAHFARHLQGDAARHLDPYLKFYGDQFQIQDGVIGRLVKEDSGYETFVPAGKAVDDLFAGDLKHLVQQSKAGNLPPASHRGNGQPIHRQPSSPTRPFFMDAVVDEIAKDRPELAATLAPAPNGTTK